MDLFAYAIALLFVWLSMFAAATLAVVFAVGGVVGLYRWVRREV